MEPHSWIIAVAGMAYLYFLCQIYDKKKVYLIKKSRIFQPLDSDIEGIKQWQVEVRAFQREIKFFRIKSVLIYLGIATLEIFAHVYFGDHLAQMWFITLTVCVVFLAGLLTLLYDMREHDKFEEKKYKSTTSLLFS